MSDAVSNRYFDRELSWLAFNERVLQEAQNPDVPLFERLKFLAIFSSNLDEFFRVRVASLRHLLRLKKKKQKTLDFDPEELLREIHRIVTSQQETYGAIFREEVLPELERIGIHLVDERQLTDDEAARLRPFFWEQIDPLLHPVLLDREGEAPFLKNKGLYLVTELWEREGTISLSALEARYALVEVPSPPLPRFIEVPGVAGPHRVLFLDDVIRRFLPEIFPVYDVGKAHAIKLSRDADLYLDDEFSGSVKDMIAKALAKRPLGTPTRFLYDQHLPQNLLVFLKERLDLENEDLIEGGRYHNLNDLFSFPHCGIEGHVNEPLPPLAHPDLKDADSLLQLIAEKDRLLYFPYQRFGHVLHLLDEAAEDPDVEELWITLYRVASNSGVAKALIKAAKQGKRVTAFVEAKARFDEASNLQWAERMEEAGVQVIYSMLELKVHTKLFLIARREDGRLRHYAYLGTGNFNEKTATLYTDLALLTADPRLADEVRQVFAFLNDEVEQPAFEHLLVAPFYMRDRFYELIDREIEHVRAGRAGGVLAKMNALEDPGMVDKLYEASRAGVPVRLIVRGLCCLVPSIEGMSEHIIVTSIVGRFLEHARAYVFHNDGAEQVYLASADWMKRNLNRRVEVAFPLYDPDIREEVLDLLNLQVRDNTKARLIDAEQQNRFVADEAAPIVAQLDTYRHFERKLHDVFSSALLKEEG